MARAPLTGSRIRAMRADRGMRQAELARRCEISPSYLNLIEHNRRRIGGALLNRMADALEVDAVLLSEGAEHGLTTAIDAAAMRLPEAGAEIDRAEDLAGRFPGWARLIQAQHSEALRLERVIEGLSDRLTHDPILSASLHDVLSSITAIRSASSILAEGGEIAPEWQARFHRNILEDSRRLVASAEQLVAYLDADADTEQGLSLPQDDVEAWLEAAGWRFLELERDGEGGVAAVMAAPDAPKNAAARAIAEAVVERYAADAQAVPEGDLRALVADPEHTPAQLARVFGVSLPVVFRRLAALPAEAFADAQPRGLVACDASGALIFRKTIGGFDLPRYGAACPLLPLFVALQRPMQPVRQALRMNGQNEVRFLAWAFAETLYPSGYDAPGITESWMLIVPQLGAGQSEAPMGVGTNCRICPERDCAARREASLVGSAAVEPEMMTGR